MDRFNARDLVVETKPDLTPVSDADKAVERMVRDAVAAERPGDGVLGEEYAELVGTSGRRWIVDPVDGTKNFVRGVPVWATVIALQDADGRIVVGLVSAPALGRRWWATLGGGAWVTEPGTDGRAADPGVAGARARRREPRRTPTVLWVPEENQAKWDALLRSCLARRGVRRLLEPRARRRGRGRHRRASPSSTSTTSRACHWWSPRPAGGSPASTGSTARPVAAASPRTGSCTTPWSRRCADLAYQRPSRAGARSTAYRSNQP